MGLPFKWWKVAQKGLMTMPRKHIFLTVWQSTFGKVAASACQTVTSAFREVTPFFNILFLRWPRRSPGHFLVHRHGIYARRTCRSPRRVSIFKRFTVCPKCGHHEDLACWSLRQRGIYDCKACRSLWDEYQWMLHWNSQCLFDLSENILFRCLRFNSFSPGFICTYWMTSRHLHMPIMVLWSVNGDKPFSVTSSLENWQWPMFPLIKMLFLVDSNSPICMKHRSKEPATYSHL